ncbi:MAG: 50S ribosomal protein L6 [Candidatus Shapirobacteria bacterium]
MSKIGQQPVLIPDSVEVVLEPDKILVKGVLGEVNVEIPLAIKVKREDNSLIITRHREDKKTRANHGTVRSLLSNAVKGVSEGWERQLEVVGTGYKVNLKDNWLELILGYSHPVKVEVPGNLKAEAAENKITIKGPDRQQVGLFAARLRKVAPPDAYKGKGIRYSDEEIKLKPGKIAKSEAGA